ncbi:hypothetical protein HU200_009668 [Digitaria exilis]|uniref:C2H2-type domain-containing protein n=1 Tax=Digitaria exilis TaxID=1010633 RepID=A0A835FJN6_9POAL|nr:hypothetical protein HU200_009668 [Digitaria exilis]
MKDKYGNPPIYITENGTADLDTGNLSKEDALDDNIRLDYLQRHISTIKESIDLGAEVQGHFAWSLLDNFEWTNGYTPRFGLIYVDRDDGFKRYMKKSARWFSEFNRAPRKVFDDDHAIVLKPALDTSILTRRHRDNDDRSRTASSRSLKIPSDLDVDAVYSATISATSSFNSDATSAMASSSSASVATTVTTTTTTASSSPLSSPAPSFAAGSGSSFRGVHQIRKLSGCYECRHSVFDPRSLAAAAAVFHCSDCGEVFAKADSLELHKATKHAVSELGPEDTSRNIVEIIFKSSWLMRKQAPVCKIDRILKVQNSDRTVKRFEQYKESIKERASGDEGKKNARCVADGNELLRFHCTTFSCSIGAAGGTALCRSPEMQCKLCAIIRDGFRVDGDGKIATMATSGRAHDVAEVVSEGEKKAMLVCRVVAGRVKKACGTTKSSEDRDVDSVSPSSETVYSDLDELFVFNPRAILPCFVVIYSGY